MSSRVQVVGAVPTGAKIWSRRSSNISAGVAVGAVAADGDADGDGAGRGGAGARTVRSGEGAGLAGGRRTTGGGGVTVTEGTGTPPGVPGPLGGSGAAGGCGLGLVGSGGVPSSGRSGAEVGGGVCETAVPTRHSSIRAELPSSFNRFRRIDMARHFVAREWDPEGRAGTDQPAT
jgi:hypothetical protein